MPFPTSFPGEAYLKVAVTLKALASGQAVPYTRRDAVQAAYDVLGHLTDQTLNLLGDQASPVMEAVENVQAAEWFDTVGRNATDPTVQAAWQVPAWAVPIILELVRKLLESAF